MLSADESSSRARTAIPPVLCFHKVSSSVTFGSTNYSPSRLRRLLLELRDGGFSLGDASAGERSAPRDSIVLTFDDSYAHLLSAIPPLIEEFGVRPLVYVPTAWIGQVNKWDYSYHLRRERHLTATELRQLRDIGVRFGSHGHTHVDLVSLRDDQLRREFILSKTILEEISGQEITSISYPFGRADDHVAGAAQEAGFRTGFTMRYPESSDLALRQGRYPIYFYDTPKSVRRKLGTGLARQVERVRSTVTSRLSYGTILLNRLRGSSDISE